MSGPGASLSFDTGNKEHVFATPQLGAPRSDLALSARSPTCPPSGLILQSTRLHQLLGLPGALIRLCVAIEDSSDLIDDLDKGVLEGSPTVMDGAGNYTCVRRGKGGTPGGQSKRSHGPSIGTHLIAKPSTCGWLV